MLCEKFVAVLCIIGMNVSCNQIALVTHWLHSLVTLFFFDNICHFTSFVTNVTKSSIKDIRVIKVYAYIHVNIHSDII